MHFRKSFDSVSISDFSKLYNQVLQSPLLATGFDNKGECLLHKSKPQYLTFKSRTIQQ